MDVTTTRSVEATTPGDIHRTLLRELGTHINRENNPAMVDSWIIGMKEFRPVVPQRWSWIDDINYLENVGYLDIGKYSVLKKIVRSFSRPLERMIDHASEEIKTMQSEGNVDSVFIRSLQIQPGENRMAEKSDVDTTPGEIHRKLLDHLANDYFIDSNSRNYRTWKIHFEKYRDAANHNEYSILQDFDHLKAQHDLEVGKYDALLDIFKHIDKRAVRRIEQDTEKIRCMLRNQKTPTQRDFTADIRVDLGGKGLPVVEKLIRILIGFTAELDRLQQFSNFDVIDSGLTLMRRSHAPDCKALHEIIGNNLSSVERFLSSCTYCRNIHQSADNILLTLLQLFDCFKTRHRIIRHRIAWENCIFITVEFTDAFNFDAGFRGFTSHSLKGDVFEHFQEIFSKIFPVKDY